MFASAHHGVASGEPMYDIWAQSNVSSDMPWRGKMSHAQSLMRSDLITDQAARVPKQLVDHDIVRDDPTDPVEVRHCLEDVVGEPIPAERPQENK